MNLDKEKIKTSIDDISNSWGMSGHFVLTKGDEVIHNNHYGYSNRKKKIGTTQESKYILDSKEMFFVSMAVLIAIDQGKLKLSNTLDKFIEEFKHGKEITVENLLSEKSSLVDYYYECLMVELEANEVYSKLSSHEQVREENYILIKNRKFKEAYSLIENRDLEGVPGGERLNSKTNALFLCEVLERVTGQKIYDFLKVNIFDVLGITPCHTDLNIETLSYAEHKRTELVDLPFNFDVEGIFTITINDMVKLTDALKTKKIFSAALWKKILKTDSEGNGIIFDNVNGYECFTSGFLGYGYNGYIDFKKNIAFTILANEQQTFRFEDNSWHYYRKDVRETVSSLLTYPDQTKMVKLSKKNFWYATGISIEAEQNNFVLDAKTSVAMGLMYTTKKVFVQMEGKTTIGLLVLNMDKKKNDYNIDIVIIDKRFQGKGYGKLMVTWAVDYLKNHGAKKLTIGVSRENFGAKKIYLNAGFVPKAVSGGGMEMVMKL